VHNPSVLEKGRLYCSRRVHLHTGVGQMVCAGICGGAMRRDLPYYYASFFPGGVIRAKV